MNKLHKKRFMQTESPIHRSTHLNDPVFPGGNLFFYWKTTASLWKKKIQESPYKGIHFVPILWTFHHMDPEHVDLGEFKPETDLALLASLFEEAGVEFIFLFPLGPWPFVAQGGVPSFVSDQYAYTENGLVWNILTGTDEIYRLISFYSPKVFFSFKKFIQTTSRYFRSKGLRAKIAGLGAYTWSEQLGHPISCITDFSPAFLSGFKRFCDQENSSESSLEKRKEYKVLIQDLYLELLKDEWGLSFLGEIPFLVLGAGGDQVFSRVWGRKVDTENYFDQIFGGLQRGFIPFLGQLNARETSPLLNQAVEDQDINLILQRKLEKDLEEDSGENYTPLIFLEVNSLQIPKGLAFEILMKFLKENYFGTYVLGEGLKYSEVGEKLTISLAENLKEKDSELIFKIFLNGGRMILDTSGIEEGLARKIELFIAENDLKEERVHLVTQIRQIRLGEGELFLFDGVELSKGKVQEIEKFWAYFFGYLNFKHIHTQGEQGVRFWWEQKISGHQEIKFLEMRRILAYNPTKSTKKIFLNFDDHFSLTKVNPSSELELRSQRGRIEVEVAPGKSVSLEFGCF